MSYNVIVAPRAEKDLKRLLENEPKAYAKALSLIGELYEHPRTGTRKQSRCQVIVRGNGAAE